MYLMQTPLLIHSLSLFPTNLPILSLYRILIIDSAEPRLQVEGFANYTDVQAADLVPWTPLKVGYSHMDANSALLTLRRVAPHFLDVVTAEAATLPEGEGEGKGEGEAGGE